MKAKKIKAIPTKYNGVQFRSRLEARWAVFFDHMRFKWRYEPEPFVAPLWGSYRPDFHIVAPGVTCADCIRRDTNHPFDLDINDPSFGIANWADDFACSCVHEINCLVEVKPTTHVGNDTAKLLLDLSEKLSALSHRDFTGQTPQAILLVLGSPSEWCALLFSFGKIWKVDPSDPIFEALGQMWNARAIESGVFADSFRFW